MRDRQEGTSPLDRLSTFLPFFGRICLCIVVVACCTPAEVRAAEIVGEPGPVVEAMNIGAVKAQTGGLLLSGQAGGRVDGALVWSLAAQLDDGQVEVPFAVEVDGGALLQGRAGRKLVIGLYAYVVDPDGRVVAHTAEGLILDPSQYRDRIVESGLKFVGRFRLDPGAYTLRVMVENNTTGEYFMSWSVVTVPAAGDTDSHLLPPLIPDSGESWVLVRQPGGRTAFELGDGTEVLPGARPLLIENRPAEIYLGGGGWEPTARIEVRILNQIGRLVFEPAVEFFEPPLGDFQFRRAVLPAIDAPPGDYSMVVTLVDEDDTEILRRATRLKIVGAGEQRHGFQQAESVHVADSAGDSEGLAASQAMSKKEIRVAYREAVGPMVDGEFAEARRRVGELERRVMAGDSKSAVAKLGEAELAEALALAKTARSCLMPLALMHRDLYRAYVARRNSVLAAHSRKMAITLAEQYGRAKPLNKFSGALMVNLASDLAQAGTSTTAREILERALDLDPKDRSALLFLGFSYERASDYLDASFEYQRLASAHPDFEEGRLRLAINLMRTGHSGTGNKILRSLMEMGSAPWIESVAAQELVRFQIRKGQMIEAERLVRSALETMPDDQRLWILLASIFEETGRFSEAVAVLSDLPPASRGVSPRARYAEWPALGVKASQALLYTMAEEAAPALQRALVARGGGN